MVQLASLAKSLALKEFKSVLDGITLLQFPLLLVLKYLWLETRTSTTLSAKNILHIRYSDTTLFGNLIGQNASVL